MTQVKVFKRDDGSIGVRNHLFILPAVVCANQVAIDVARRNPRCKYIEHQHGCAQIGADLTQTQRIFSNLSISPNVFASLFVGLGCEGIMTANLFDQSKSRTKRPMKLVFIQGVGGTLKAEDNVEVWMRDREMEMAEVAQVTVDWHHLRVGLICDEMEGRSAAYHTFVEKLQALGVQMVIPDNCTFLITGADSLPVVDHGEIAIEQTVVMKAGSNQLETATGLAAAGVHFIVHFARQAHGFGNPLVPMIRFAMTQTTYQKFQDDFDGILVNEADVDTAFQTMTRIVEGEPSAAEELGMDDFAVYRIGPTV